MKTKNLSIPDTKHHLRTSTSPPRSTKTTHQTTGAGAVKQGGYGHPATAHEGVRSSNVAAWEGEKEVMVVSKMVVVVCWGWIAKIESSGRLSCHSLCLPEDDARVTDSPFVENSLTIELFLCVCVCLWCASSLHALLHV
jgi:hypothetical protein